MPESSAWQDICRWDFSRGGLNEDDEDDDDNLEDGFPEDDDDEDVEEEEEEDEDAGSTAGSGITQQDRDNKVILLASGISKA